MKVAVIGGGVIGLCCARDLARRGAEVVLIEKGRCGGGSSLRNAGWVTPSLSTPLPEPGAISHALRWMLQRDSPFQIRPQPSLALLSWCWRFWRASSRDRWATGTAALIALNSRTFELFDELRATGVEFEMHRAGLVFATRTAGAAEVYRAHFDALAEAGWSGRVEVWNRDEVAKREPALAADRLLGVIFAPDERQVRPETLVRGLEEAARNEGVEILEGAPVDSITRVRGAWSLAAGGGMRTTDSIVVAAGVWSPALLRGLGIRLPLQPAKGYSVTAEGAGTAPTHALYLAEAKLGCSPFNGAVRIAGRLELTGFDLRVEQARVDGLINKASAYLRDWRPDETRIEWAGLRPFPPDGLPLIGAVPGHQGLYVATGHGMLGVTLAPATAAMLAPLVLDGKLDPVLMPFRPDRFG